MQINISDRGAALLGTVGIGAVTELARPGTLMGIVDAIIGVVA